MRGIAGLHAIGDQRSKTESLGRARLYVSTLLLSAENLIIHEVHRPSKVSRSQQISRTTVPISWGLDGVS